MLALTWEKERTQAWDACSTFFMHVAETVSVLGFCRRMAAQCQNCLNQSLEGPQAAGEDVDAVVVTASHPQVGKSDR